MYTSIMEVTAFRRTLGQRLRDARLAAGLSQIELAGRVGLQRVTVSNIEAGRQGVPVDRLVEMADSLQTSAGELLRDLSQEASDPFPPGLSEAQKDWLRRVRDGQ